MKSEKILLISNMYPSIENQSLGIFVKASELDLLSGGFEVDRVVITKKTSGLLAKVYIYSVFYFNVFKALIFGDYEIVYIHYVSHSSLPIIVGGFFKRFKIVTHVHGGDIKFLNGTNKFFFLIKSFISKIILKRSDLTIFPSLSYSKLASVNYNFNNYVIYPSGGVDTKLFNRKTLQKQKKVVGYAGRLVKSKNVEEIIKALIMLDSNIKLEIVGEGPEKSNLLRMVEFLNLDDRVDFYPAKSRKELSEWYKDIDILIYPSDSESLGLVPLEAMSCGTYCILSNIPAFNELDSFGFCNNA